MAEEIVKVSNLSKEYPSGDTTFFALKDVSFNIMKNEYTVMSGPSGSGKTTLLNMIGALDTPTTGDVYIDGQAISKLSIAERIALRRDKIGFVFQAYNLMPVLTVMENTEYILMLRGVPKKERREKCRAVLAEMGISGMDNRYPSQLSGGQQQRVAIARALVAEPLIILADEPTANLDTESTESLLNLTQRLNEEKGTTFFFSTHDSSVTKRAKRILFLQDGHLKYDGTFAGLQQQTHLRV